MGKRRRWSEERSGFEDVAEAVADAIRSREDKSAAERRRLEKEERRRRFEASQRRQLLGTGAGLLAGGLTASLGLYTVAAVGVGLLAGAIVIYSLKAFDERPQAPRRVEAARRPRLADPAVPGEDARASLIRSVVATAMGHLRAIDRRAQEIGDIETAAILTRIAAIGQRICQSVAAQTIGFEAAQRVLTYHAEKAAQLAEMAVMHEAAGDVARLEAVRRVLGRMETLFEETEGAIKAEDRREMDLEIRLIDQALDEDLRR